MPTPGAVPAAPGRRLLAAVIDTAAALVLGGGFVLAGAAARVADDAVPAGLSPLTLTGVVVLGGFGVFQWWYQGTRGFTLGTRLVGVRTLSARTGRPVGMGRVLLRMLVVGLALLLPVVGIVALAVSVVADRGGRRQGWHDRVAGTVVFDIGVGVDPATAHPATSGEVYRRVDRLLTSTPTAPTELSVPQAEPSRAPEPVPVTVSAAERAPEPVPTAPAEMISEVPTLRHERTPHETTDPRDPGRPEPSVGPARGSRQAPERSAGRIVPPAPYESLSSPSAELPEEVERTRLRSARSKVAYAPSRDGSSPRATLLLWDNRLIVLAGTALVGRNPSPRAGEELPVQVIAVADRGRSVSKTHLAIGVDADGVWLRDRNSTNGTIVTLADGQQILCAPEQTVRVPVGASVAFGDYWLTITG